MGGGYPNSLEAHAYAFASLCVLWDRSCPSSFPAVVIFAQEAEAQARDAEGERLGVAHQSMGCLRAHRTFQRLARIEWDAERDLLARGAAIPGLGGERAILRDAVRQHLRIAVERHAPRAGCGALRQRAQLGLGLRRAAAARIQLDTQRAAGCAAHLAAAWQVHRHALGEHARG